MSIKITSVDDYERHRRRIYVILILLLAVGLVYFIYEDYQNSTIIRLPENLGQLEAVIEGLKAENFVRSFDVMQSLIVVDEEMWKNKLRSEKLDFVTQLARYCAKKNKSRQWTIQVYGFPSNRLLAEMGKSTFQVD